MTFEEMNALSEEELRELFEPLFPILVGFEHYMGEELTSGEIGVLLFFAKWLQEHSDMLDSSGRMLS